MDHDLSQTIELSQCSQDGEKASSRSRRWSYRRSTLDHPYEPDLQLEEGDHSNGGTSPQVGHKQCIGSQIIIPLSLKAARYIPTHSPTCMINSILLGMYTIKYFFPLRACYSRIVNSDLPCTPMHYIHRPPYKQPEADFKFSQTAMSTMSINH